MKKILKKIPFLVWLNKKLQELKNKFLLIKSNTFFNREITLINDLILYAPNTSKTFVGLEKEISNLTILSAKQVFPFLQHLIAKIDKNSIQTITAEDFCDKFQGRQMSMKIKEHFDRYGCDKSLNHNYHFIYGTIINLIGNVSSMLEIGLGTTNTDVVSHMGKTWVPGASLRAFRDFLPNAIIYGADVDKRILFEEERIKTYYVDQTDLNSFTILDNSINEKLDLVIDDGLHSPNANIAVISFSINKLKKGGWIVIEDISFESLTFWQVFSKILPLQYSSYVIKCNNGYAFAIQS